MTNRGLAKGVELIAAVVIAVDEIATVVDKIKTQISELNKEVRVEMSSRRVSSPDKIITRILTVVILAAVTIIVVVGSRGLREDEAARAEAAATKAAEAAEALVTRARVVR